jgi:hypothetical protein
MVRLGSGRGIIVGITEILMAIRRLSFSESAAFGITYTRASLSPNMFCGRYRITGLSRKKMSRETVL